MGPSEAVCPIYCNPWISSAIMAIWTICVLVLTPPLPVDCMKGVDLNFIQPQSQNLLDLLVLLG